MKQLNVFGKELELCCSNPLTGAYRDGYCNTGVSILVLIQFVLL